MHSSLSKVIIAGCLTALLTLPALAAPGGNQCPCFSAEMVDATYAMSGHTPATATNPNRCRDTNVNENFLRTHIILPTLTGTATIAGTSRTKDNVNSSCNFVPMLNREAILNGAYSLNDLSPGEVYACRSEILRSTAWRLLCAASE